jgi:hypothetical protein
MRASKMPVVVNVDVKLEWIARRSSTSNRWIGSCDALNLSTEADTLDELHSLIPEAIHLLMIDLLQDDELEDYLKKRGWVATNIPPNHQVPDVEFNIPWQLIAEGQRDSPRSAH